MIIALVVFLVAMLIFAALMFHYGALWLQAYMANAPVSLASLIGMSLRGVSPSLIVTSKVMVTQAGITVDQVGINSSLLEAHDLAGGNVRDVIRAIIAAHRAGIDLDFDRAAAIDLAGRDVLDAVRTSIYPKVIDCPEPSVGSGKSTLSAIARDGIELQVRARVTVRTNFDQLIGGATEETIIARVGEGVITSIGSATTHMDVVAEPDRISKEVLGRGLDSNTAFEIVSIDIADIEIGENIGARLQADQAAADTRVAQAEAEKRRAAAMALQQEMKAHVTENHAKLVLARASVPAAISSAFRAGNIAAKGNWDEQA